MTDNPNLETPIVADPAVKEPVAQDKSAKTYTEEEHTRLATEMKNKAVAAALADKKKKHEEELEAANQLVEKYRGILENSAKAQIAKLPISEPVKELVLKLDIADQLEWLDKNAAQLTSVKSIQGVPTPKSESNSLEAVIQKKRASGIYG